MDFLIFIYYIVTIHSLIKLLAKAYNRKRENQANVK